MISWLSLFTSLFLSLNSMMLNLSVAPFCLIQGNTNAFLFSILYCFFIQSLLCAFLYVCSFVELGFNKFRPHLWVCAWFCVCLCANLSFLHADGVKQFNQLRNTICKYWWTENEWQLTSSLPLLAVSGSKPIMLDGDGVTGVCTCVRQWG